MASPAGSPTSPGTDGVSLYLEQMAQDLGAEAVNQSFVSEPVTLGTAPTGSYIEGATMLDGTASVVSGAQSVGSSPSPARNASRYSAYRAASPELSGISELGTAAPEAAPIAPRLPENPRTDDDAAWASQIMRKLEVESKRIPWKANLRHGRRLSATSVTQALGFPNLARSESSPSVGIPIGVDTRSPLSVSSMPARSLYTPPSPPAPSSLGSPSASTTCFQVPAAQAPVIPSGVPALDMGLVRMGYEDDDEESCVQSLNLVSDGPMKKAAPPPLAGVPSLNIAALQRTGSAATSAQVTATPALRATAARGQHGAGSREEQAAAAAGGAQDVASNACLARLREMPLHVTTQGTQPLLTPPRLLSHTMRRVSASSPQMAALGVYSEEAQGKGTAATNNGAKLGLAESRAGRTTLAKAGTTLAKTGAAGKNFRLSHMKKTVSHKWQVPHQQFSPQSLHVPPMVAHLHNHYHHHYHLFAPPAKSAQQHCGQRGAMPEATAGGEAPIEVPLEVHGEAPSPQASLQPDVNPDLGFVAAPGAAATAVA